MWWSPWAAAHWVWISLSSAGNRSFTHSSSIQAVGLQGWPHPSPLSVIGQESSLEPIRAGYWWLSESVIIKTGPISQSTGLRFHGLVPRWWGSFLSTGGYRELNSRCLLFLKGNLNLTCVTESTQRTACYLTVDFLYNLEFKEEDTTLWVKSSLPALWSLIHVSIYSLM